MSILRLPRTIAVDPELALQRTLEAIPGLFSWGTLLTLFTLAVVRPFTVAVFLILYDFYWLVRALYIGIHLVASYRILRRMQRFDWRRRLPFLDDPGMAIPIVEARLRDSNRQLAAARSRRERRVLRHDRWREEKFLHDLKNRYDVILSGSEGSRMDSSSASPPQNDKTSWRNILHVVILPTYREPLALLQQSLDALAAVDYPKDRLWVVAALEERAGDHARAVQDALTRRYQNTFGRFLTTVHPDGIAGERRVKSANASHAARRVQRLLDTEGIPYERVMVSNLDADTVVSKQYFAALTYTYQTTPDRLRCSYQPLPMYHNNIWTISAFTRIIATNATFWQIIQAGRPERLETYSSHAMPFQALVDVGFWDPTVVSEDSRIYWQAYVRYQGRYRVVPLYATVSMDATQGPTLLQGFTNQYRQMRRHAWGIENFPYVARSFLRPSAIPIRERLRRIFWMLEAWHSWATASFILAGLGWFLILFGESDFQRTILAFNLPRVTSTLLTVSMGGLILNATLSLLLLPPAPARVPRRRYAWVALQWIFTPLTASLLGALPALDAQTRLLFGRYLGFWVTPKVRPALAPATAVTVKAARR